MNLTPRALQDAINTISDEYYAACQEMADIAERKGTEWLVLRKSCKTNAECDQQWAATADGKNENRLKWLIKGMEKKRGALMLEHRANQGLL